MSDMRKLSIGVAVFTLNAEKHLEACLTPFLNSKLHPRLLVVDSSSNDGTEAVAKKLNVETLIIARNEFNHGLTREKARKHLGTDIVVMLTPDAYALNENVLEALVEPIVSGNVVLSYARQIPHNRHNIFEAFPRYFNYPEKSEIRSIKDLNRLGKHTFFCSDSCCAYLNKALDDIGGFRNVILGEDTFAAADLLRKGYRIAYTAEAVVKHSHHYSLKQEFQRYFDTGLVRTEFANLLYSPKTDQDRGKEFVHSFFKHIRSHYPYLLPYAFLHVFSKWLGYYLGTKCIKAPVWLKRILSSQKFYWDYQYTGNVSKWGFKRDESLRD